MTPYHQAALAVLWGLGRRLDAAVTRHASERELDGRLTEMRMVHLGVVGHLAEQAGAARQPQDDGQAPTVLRVRRARQAAGAPGERARRTAA